MLILCFTVDNLVSFKAALAYLVSIIVENLVSCLTEFSVKDSSERLLKTQIAFLYP